MSAAVEYAAGPDLMTHAPDGTPVYRSAYHGLADALGVDVYYVAEAASRNELRSLWPATTPGEVRARLCRPVEGELSGPEAAARLGPRPA